MPAGCAADLPPAPEPNGIAGDLSREQVHWIPVTDAAGDQPAPAVVINHAKSPTESERGTLKSAPCTLEAVRWFTGRDYVAVVPIRRGYGATGGSMMEVKTDCAAGPRDYTRNAREIAYGIDAAVQYATSLAFVRPSGMVVVG